MNPLDDFVRVVSAAINVVRKYGAVKWFLSVVYDVFTMNLDEASESRD